MGCRRKDERVCGGVKKDPRAVLGEHAETVCSEDARIGQMEQLAGIIGQRGEPRRVGGRFQIRHRKKHDGLFGINANTGRAQSAARVVECDLLIGPEIIHSGARSELAQRRSEVTAESEWRSLGLHGIAAVRAYGQGEAGRRLGYGFGAADPGN